MPFLEGIPTVVVQLDKPRTLGFTLGSMRRIQEVLGTLEYRVDAAADMLAVPTYVWACMDAEGRAELSIEQVEEMIHPGNLKAMSEACTTLFHASSPEAKEGADQTPGPTTAGG